MADSLPFVKKITSENLARPRKPDTVIPVKEIGLVLYPDDEAVGLQFEDGAGKQVFLWLPGSLLSALGKQLIEVVVDYPQTATWEARVLKLNLRSLSRPGRSRIMPAEVCGRRPAQGGSLMSHERLYPILAEVARKAWVDEKKYFEMYDSSVRHPESFWGEQGKRLHWFKPYTKVKDTSFLGDVQIRWYEDGALNASYNCIDRHLSSRGGQAAILWEGDSPEKKRRITFTELHENVCRFANVLKQRGVGKGDRVTIYMPMIPETTYAMLACARIGAIHSVVFGGFSPESLAVRIQDCQSRWVVTADEGLRGGRFVPLKANLDEALKQCPDVGTVIVVRHAGRPIAWVEGRDIWHHEAIANVSPACVPTEMNAEDPLFILYTSGSTGRPKAVVHTTGGYLVYVSMTHQYVFDYHDGDVYWCTADIGWVTGHSYIVYGPLANGATTVMFEGIPNYPDPSRFWRIVDEYKVNIFYTAPTAIRSLMREGEKPVKATSRQSLRLLGSVGEPINPEAWEWYHRVVGDDRCPIVDTWWQTETGGILIAPLPGAM